MEKLIYPLWKHEHQNGDQLRDALLAGLRRHLDEDKNTVAARLAVADSAVAAAERRVIANRKNLPDGMLSLWVHQSEARVALEQQLDPLVGRFTGYLVTESEPLPNTRHRALPGERVYGMNQVVFLQCPPRLSEAEWLHRWQEEHTQVAIDTQATFGYRQNVIVRPLCLEASPVSAVVEENFPPEAMVSDHAFYGADDDPTLAANMDAMIKSCARFIDFDKIDVIPMSEYVLHDTGQRR